MKNLHKNCLRFSIWLCAARARATVTATAKAAVKAAAAPAVTAAAADYMCVCYFKKINKRGSHLTSLSPSSAFSIQH